MKVNKSEEVCHPTLHSQVAYGDREAEKDRERGQLWRPRQECRGKGHGEGVGELGTKKREAGDVSRMETARK